MERIHIRGPAVAAPLLRARSGIGRKARFFSASLICLAAVSAPDLAYAAPGGGGGGGFHGGGFGGFHAGGLGGLHAGVGSGFHAGGLGGIHPPGVGGVHAPGIGGVHTGGPGGFRTGGPGGTHTGGFSGSGFHVLSSGAGADASHVGIVHDGSRGDSIVLRGGERTGHWSYGWRNGHYGNWWGYDPYLWSSDGLYDDYSGDDQSYAAQSGYYCSNPAGYYPYVTQCNTSWQIVPAQ
jgi:hypothetical protein